MIAALAQHPQLHFALHQHLAQKHPAEWLLDVIDTHQLRPGIIQIEEDLTLLVAISIDGDGGKHPLSVIEEATENAAVTQALLDN